MTSTTVTTGQYGSLNPQLTREACRRVSRTHRPSSAHHCLPVRFVLTVVVDDSFNRLNPRAISGDMTTSSGTREWDMGSTGTESDSVSAHAAPHFGLCAGQPPDDDEPRRTDSGHLTITAATSPAPVSVGLARSGHPPVNHSLSWPSLTAARRKPQGGTGHHTLPIYRYLALPPTTTRTDAPPLTRCRLRLPARISIGRLASSAPVAPMNRNRCSCWAQVRAMSSTTRRPCHGSKVCRSRTVRAQVTNVVRRRWGDFADPAERANIYAVPARTSDTSDPATP